MMQSLSVNLTALRKSLASDMVSRIIAIGGLLLFLGLLRGAEQFRLSDIDSRYVKPAHRTFLALENATRNNLALVDIAGGLLSPTNAMNLESFRIFASKASTNLNGIFGFVWAPLVRHEDRQAFEQASAEELGVSDFAILRPRADGIRELMDEQAMYFPALYLYPEVTNATNLGNEATAYTSYSRRTAERARDSGEIATAGRIDTRLIPNVAGTFSLWRAVYRHGESIDTVEQRRAALKGYLIGVFGLKEALDPITVGAGQGLTFTLFDLGSKPPQLIYSSDGTKRTYQPEASNTVSRVYQMADAQWAMLASWQSNGVLKFLNPVPLMFLGMVIAALIVRTKQIQAQQALLQREEALAGLNTAQGQLVESEKMAALGQLVAGVAHEINTPVGIGVTAASQLHDSLADVRRSFDAGALNKSVFRSFLESCEQGTALILKNLERAANLIASFKRVAVDRSSDELREVELSGHIDDLMLSLHPMLKHKPIEVRVEVPEDIRIQTYPGAIAQILTNLMSNSLHHGFDQGQTAGNISIRVMLDAGICRLRYEDNGKGIDDAYMDKVFDPFFTTARSSGGSGLGLHIIYNLVTQKLGSNLQYGSEANRSTWFEFELHDLGEVADERG